MRLKRVYILAVLGLLFFTGCGEGTYVAEKKFFKANVKFYDLNEKKQKGTLSDKDIDEVILLFKEIALKYPFWPKTAEVHLKIGKLLEQKGKPEAAIKEYEKIVNDFPRNLETAAVALKSIAVYYESRSNWPEAETRYKMIIKNYPYTTIGLVVPIYLAKEYAQKGDFEKARQSYQEAIEFYQGIIEKDVREETILRLMDFMLTCYLDLNQTQQALDFLDKLKNKNQASIVAARCLFKTAEIYEIKLSDQALARKYYEKLIEQFPDLSISEQVREKIGQDKR